MKRYLMTVFALIMGLSLVTVSFAQPAPKATPEKPAATEKAAPATPAPEKKVEKKTATAKEHQYTGEVVTMDAATKTLTIKGKQGEKAFDVTDVKMEKAPAVGDKVMVKYTEKDGKMTAKSVKAVKTDKKAEKKEEKKEKKEEKKDTKAAEKPAAPQKAPATTPAK